MTKYQKQRAADVKQLIAHVSAGISEKGKYWTPRTGNCSNILPDLERIYYAAGFAERRFVPRSPSGYYETHRASHGEVNGETYYKLDAVPKDVLEAACKLAADRVHALDSTGQLAVDDMMIFDALGQIASD